MNAHLNDGQLRAALDGESSAAERQHLQDCAACRARQSALRAQVRQAVSPLDFLAPTAQDSDLGARMALHRFHQRRTEKEIPMFKRLFTSTAFRYVAVFLLLLAAILATPNGRALADQFLNLFRVQQVAIVPIDFTGMQQLTGQGPIGQRVSQLISNSITITQEPGEPLDATDAEQATQLAGFRVRLPQGQTPSHISVMPAAAFSFQIDHDKAQTLLNDVGRSDLVLPKTIDGADIAVSIPANVSAAYGDCPRPKEKDEGSGSRERQYTDCILLAQLPSPTVSAPAGVDVAQLAQIGLEFSGMSPEEAAVFTENVDWTSTLVIPIPRDAASYEQVTVDGVSGTLVQRLSNDGDAPQFILIWVKEGIIYALNGLGSDTEAALEMANSLP